MKYRLGKKAARLGAIKFKFGNYFDARQLPVPPQVIGHELIGHPWRMLANDKHSCCVFSGFAHQEMLWTHEGSGSIGCDFTDQGVLSDYAAVTGWDGTDATDAGTDMAEASAYFRKTGIIDSLGKRHRIDAYCTLEPGNPENLALAVYLTGAVGIGVRTPDNVDKLFDQHKPWDVYSGTKTEGGHYIPCIGRNSLNQWVVVTWGGLQGMTQKFYETYCDEAVIHISLETLRRQTARTPDGFAIDEIRRDLAALAA